jgi:hypothetical protein
MQAQSGALAGDLKALPTGSLLSALADHSLDAQTSGGHILMLPSNLKDPAGLP